jgi:hypothetical protein
VVYDRSYDDRDLNFEPSGALYQGSLMMRDQETDSWWSIMSSTAVQGEMEGAPLRELPYSTKTTWGEWRRRHPDSLVLSIDGKTFEPENVYAGYHADPDRTYRNIQPEDDRLPGKESIYAFRIRDEPIAVPHRRIEGGFIFEPEESTNARVLLFRTKGASPFESTRAYRFPKDFAGTSMSVPTVLDRIENALEAGRGEEEGIEVLTGMDTYWYNWAPQNPGTRIIQ